jgi:hypothetical protein
MTFRNGNRRQFLQTAAAIAATGLGTGLVRAKPAAIAAQVANLPGEKLLSPHFRGQLSGLETILPAAPRPDDLDLVAMARAALNYLRGNPMPERNYECRFSLGPLGIPNTVPLVPSDKTGFDPIANGDADCRMVMQFPHIREMIGLPTADAVELGVSAKIHRYQHADDHLCWISPECYTGEASTDQWIGPWTTAKLLYCMAEEYQRGGDKAVKENARKTFLGLKGIAMWDGPRAYYEGIAPYKNGQWCRQGWCEANSHNYPFIVEPLVRYAEICGDQEAIEFAKAMTEGFLAGSQKNMGNRKIDPKTGAYQDHVHCHTHAVWGVAHLGAVLNEPRYLDWARKVHDFTLSVGTDYGWMPETYPQGEYRAEVCAVGDMVSMSAWLARAGWPHYWDQVERAVRNVVRRAQFSLTPAFLRLFHEIHKEKPEKVLNDAIAELRRLEGGFVAQPTLDDWVAYPHNPKLGTPGLNSNGMHMMGCCPPEGMRSLWEAWCGAVVEQPEGVMVNMAISRDHPAAKVEAFAAECGGLRATVRKPGNFLLRPPAWAAREAVQLQRNGRDVPLSWSGPQQAYVICPAAAAGEQLTLRWPVAKFKQTFVPKSVPGRTQSVAVRWTGNRVDAVEPHGQYLPMFPPAV